MKIFSFHMKECEFLWRYVITETAQFENMLYAFHSNSFIHQHIKRIQQGLKSKTRSCTTSWLDTSLQNKLSCTYKYSTPWQLQNCISCKWRWFLRRLNFQTEFKDQQSCSGWLKFNVNQLWKSTVKNAKNCTIVFVSKKS